MQSDRNFQQELNNYKHQIKTKLICNTDASKSFFEDMQNCIDEYADSTENPTIDDIVKEFGKPEEIAKSFYNETDMATVKRKLNVKKIIIAFVVAAIAIIGISFAIATINAKNATSTYETHDDMGVIEVEDVSDNV